MSKLTHIQEPLNVQEQYLYGINIRLEVLIDQISSLLQHIASTQNVSVEENKVEEVAPSAPTRTRRKA
jgi:hypothetical protein